MRYYDVNCASSVDDQVVIEGEHKWILPGLICPACGTWGAVGIEFPCIEPSPKQRRYFKKGPQPLDWFKNVLPHSGLPCSGGPFPEPTTEFGAFQGKVEFGKMVTDFIWPRPWTILIRRKVKDLLAESNLRVRCFAETQIQRAGKLNERFYELQIEAGLMLDESCLERSGPDCQICGRSPLKLSSKPLKLRMGTLHDDVFRAANFPTSILATEKFVSLCKEQSFSNITFQAVEMAG